MLVWEIKQRGYCYYLEVDYFAIKAHPEVFHSSYKTAICQQFLLKFIRMTFFFSSLYLHLMSWLLPVLTYAIVAIIPY